MKNTQRLTLSALFTALGLVMPFLTMQIPEIGKLLLPMHIPVLLCGFVCGWKYGLCTGFIVPLLRCLIWGAPALTSAVPMAFELAAYGAAAGFLYSLLHGKKLAVYISLIGAMIFGRIVWGIASFLFLKLLGSTFTWELFAAGAFFQAIPGILLQLVLIPAIITILHRGSRSIH